MSQANHDPDFDLAKGSHQVALNLSILVQMISERNHKQSTQFYTGSNKVRGDRYLYDSGESTNHDPDFDLA